MDEQTFQNLIQRYQDNVCSPMEKQLIESWLDSLEQKAAGRFEGWDEIEKHNVKNQIFTSLKLKIGIERPPSRRLGNHVFLLKVAASVAIWLGCCFWMLTAVNDTQNGVATSFSDHTPSLKVDKSILPDGTIVWLKGDSKIYFPSSFTGPNREVRLEGEALFEVAKDPSKPFILHCGSLITKVMGTSFNIKSQPDKQQVEVVVFTGRVSLSDSANLSDQGEIFLLPREKALYKKSTRAITKAAEKGMADYLIGTEYDMHFEDTPVAEIVERIEQKFNVKIRLENEKAKQCVVSADLTDQSLPVTLKLICQSLGGDFQQNDEWVSLRIPPCK